MAGKWDKGLAKEICSWIQRATGVSVPSDDPSDFAEELKNGQTLCQYGLIIVFVTFKCRRDYIKRNFCLSRGCGVITTLWRFKFNYKGQIQLETL